MNIDVEQILKQVNKDLVAEQKRVKWCLTHKVCNGEGSLYLVDEEAFLMKKKDRNRRKLAAWNYVMCMKNMRKYNPTKFYKFTDENGFIKYNEDYLKSILKRFKLSNNTIAEIMNWFNLYK